MEIGKAEFDLFRADMQSFKDEVRSGFGVLIQLQGETNSSLTGLSRGLDDLKLGLSETNARLDRTNVNLEILRSEVSGKLDGISSFLLSSEQISEELDSRVAKLEERVDRLEKDGPAA